MSGPSLQLIDLVKHYHGGDERVRAVDGVTLTIEPSELVALYGPSGSGKSTLLMLAASLLVPDAGRVIFDHRDIGTLTPKQSAAYRAREVGLVSQDLQLMPGASALDNALIKLPVLGLSLREARARALPWLERLGLADRASHIPQQLSIGERQRVTIARALVAEPRLLLADEPTGNLDSARTKEVLALLRSLCKEREMPGLLVTHDPIALAYVDRAISLRDGRLHDFVDEEPAEPAGSRA